MNLPLLALMLAAAGVDSSRPPDAEFDLGLAQHAAGPERAVWASRLLLGAPYLLSPLGDRVGPDVGPRFRLDAFNCVTYVETVIALANSTAVAQASLLLDDVRYHGPPDYAHRNHYVEAQWIPSNLAKGWVAEATRSVAGPLAETATKSLTPATWQAAEQARRVLVNLPANQRPVGSFSLEIVPLLRIAEIESQIPEGTVLFVVREDSSWRPYRVTHAGIVVTGRRGERLLRHASDVPRVLRVRDEPLGKFLARNARYQEWPVSGASLFTIRDNRERVYRLIIDRGATADAARMTSK